MTLEELGKFGMERLTDEEINGVLNSQYLGVLGLPTDEAPSLRPMSFWYDGDDALYFLYVLGSESRKDELSRAAEAARFLVYRAETAFNWRSVLLTGTIDPVPEEERTAVADAMEQPWRPDLFERATNAGETALYRFEITERTGVKHLGLPPGFDTADDG